MLLSMIIKRWLNVLMVVDEKVYITEGNFKLLENICKFVKF